MKYGIWAKVSGGVTGTREAWVKSGGKVQLFDTLAEAVTVADDFMATMQGDPHRTCEFSYVAKEFRI